jgi:glyoxylase-like metal-dependent hydrolase (beta-lactamase superfamily II)
MADAESPKFLTEPVPARGVPIKVRPGISRVVADNPSVMTYHGTNTYLIEDGPAYVVIDPGPDDKKHVEDILKATGGKISRIVLTHTHHDHLGALPAIKAATGAPTYGYAASADDSFTADVPLKDGDTVGDLTAVFTPGHAMDHLCFARADGLLFSGDHVMGWSSTIVNPPKGNMRHYCASLRALLARGDSIYLPGHGPAIEDPRSYVSTLLFHREQRENAILTALREQGASTTYELMDRLYSQINPTLRRAAERNVIAHLIKLESEGHAVRDGEVWRAA